MIVRIWFDVVEVLGPTGEAPDLATGVAGVSATDKKSTGADVSYPEEGEQFSRGGTTSLPPPPG